MSCEFSITGLSGTTATVDQFLAEGDDFYLDGLGSISIPDAETLSQSEKNIGTLYNFKEKLYWLDLHYCQKLECHVGYSTVQYSLDLKDSGFHPGFQIPDFLSEFKTTISVSTEPISCKDSRTKMAWRFLLCFMLLDRFCKPVICRITGPTSLVYFVGDNARLRWNTDNTDSTILSATWGIKKDNIADPQFINVDITSSKVNLNSDLEPNLIKRLSFDGDLRKGLAWFTLKNVTFNDTNTYIAFISDDITRILPFTVVLTVQKRKEEDEQNDVSTKETREKQQVAPSRFPQPVNTTTTETVNSPKDPKEPVHSIDYKTIIIVVGVLVIIISAVSVIFLLVKKKRNRIKNSGERDVKSSEKKLLKIKV